MSWKEVEKSAKDQNRKDVEIIHGMDGTSRVPAYGSNHYNPHLYQSISAVKGISVYVPIDDQHFEKAHDHFFQLMK